MPTQSQPDLVQHLREQLGFLRSSGAAFDAGEQSEAKRLATAIRILVHDTSQSTSLLLQLGVKDTLRFVDTSNPPYEPSEPGVLTSTMDAGLAAIHFGTPPYIAILGEKERLEAKHFDQWWTSTILRDHPRNEFSRQGLVLALAHLDGGAHVDPTLEGSYAALSRSNSLGWSFYRGDERLPDQSPVPANVRQIAYELQATLEEQLTDLIGSG